MKSLKLILASPGKWQFKEEEVQPLGPSQVQVRTYVTGIRHAEDLFYYGKEGSPIRKEYPWSPSGWGAGEVMGSGGGGFKPGDWVFGPMYHQQVQVMELHRTHALTGLQKEFSVFVDPGLSALRAVHAARIRYGNSLAIFGMGAVGLMAMQYALGRGVRELIAVEPLPNRLKTAQRLGARELLQGLDDPRWQEEAVREGCRPHAAIELSGSDRSLHQAVKWVREGGAVVAGGRQYSTEAMQEARQLCKLKSIHFMETGEENSTPEEEETVIYSLLSKAVIVWPIAMGRFSFREASEAYQAIQSEPDRYIKSLLYYS